MENQSIILGKRMKESREILGISSEEMAKSLNISHQAYLDCETGVSDPSFTFLHKCANILKMDLSELVSGTDPKLSLYTLSKKGAGLPIQRREGFQYKHLASLLKNRLSDPFMVHVHYTEKDAQNPIPLSTHAGQEFNYVLKGTLKIQIENHTEYLKAGDSIYYNSNHPHGMVAWDGEDCEFLSLVINSEGQAMAPPTLVNTSFEHYAEEDRLYRKYVTEKINKDGILEDITFDTTTPFNFAFDVVDTLAKKNPEKKAMVWVSEEKDHLDFTFSDMASASAKAANYFKSLGIKKGDKVMVILRRHYQFWFTLLGLSKIGAIAIPATDLCTKKDLVYRFNAAGVKAVVCTSKGIIAEAVEEAVKECPQVTLKVLVNSNPANSTAISGWHDFNAGLADASPAFNRPTGSDAIKNTDPMLMYFTSGTTGFPKIVTHNYTYPLGHIITARWWHNVDPNGLHFTMSDTGWAKSVWGKLYGQWLCEAAIFTYDFERFDPQDILQMFSKHQITTFCAPPTIYRMFIKEDLSKHDLSSLKYATIAGEALNPEVYEQFLKATGLKLMEGFGQTEMTLSIANLVGMEPKPGSMGKPNPQYAVSLVMPDGTPAKEGEVGEIVLETDKKLPCGMFQGYYEDNELTKSVWKDGIYHTGDVAWFDEDGYYWYVGRIDDLIKSSGYRIGPFEIESVIMELPYVLECAITGVEDEVRGQIVKATIVLTKDKTGSDALKKEIQEYVKEHTAPYKYPRIIDFVEVLPKTISGKIRRVELR